MSIMSKRATIYFNPKIHKILKMKALEIDCSISDLVNEAVRKDLAEDQEDLEAFDARVNEPTVSYQSMLKELKRDGKI